MIHLYYIGNQSTPDQINRNTLVKNLKSSLDPPFAS